MLSKIKHSSLILFFSLLLPNLISAQLNCDTLFLTNGEAILINANHLKFKKNIRYENCGLDNKDGKISIPQKEVERIGVNRFLLTAKRKPLKEYNTRIYFMDDSKKSGKLVGVNDSSIIIKHNKILLYKYEVNTIKELQVQKNNIFTGVLIGGSIGTVLGFALGGLSGGDNGSIERFANQAGGGFLGFLSGAFVGAAVGGVKLKIPIDGDHTKYMEGIGEIKFVY